MIIDRIKLKQHKYTLVLIGTKIRVNKLINSRLGKDLRKSLKVLSFL